VKQEGVWVGLYWKSKNIIQRQIMNCMLAMFSRLTRAMSQQILVHLIAFSLVLKIPSLL